MSQHISSDIILKSCRICRDVKFTNGMSFVIEQDWLQLYEFCFNLSVTPEDTPRVICGVCAGKLKDFNNFKSEAVSSDMYWKSNINISSKCFTQNHGAAIKHEDIIPEEINFVHLPYLEKNTKVTKYEFDDLVTDAVEYNETNSCMSSNIKSEVEGNDCDSNKSEYQLNCVPVKNNNKVNKLLLKTAKRKSHDTNRKKVITEVKRHPDDSNLTCGLCDVTSPDRNQLKHHLTAHSKSNDLNCRLCDFVGRDFADMVSHRYSHHPKKSRRHINCHLCDKKYLVILALQFHYRSVHLEKKGGICSQCGKQLSTYKIWRNHEKLHRTENYKCDLCGKKFLFRHALKTHMIHHSEVNGYVCDVCGRGFKRNSNLKIHQQTAHDCNKVQCDHCNGTFKNQMSLRAHLQRVTREKKHQCEVCSKYFHSPNMLRRHMVWHGNERPYVCSVCGLTYKSTSQLNIHMRKHTGVMPFKCNHCTKCYPTSNQLREHMSNHSGVRRYKCSYCTKSFHRKQLMVQHCNKRHSGLEVGLPKK